MVIRNTKRLCFVLCVTAGILIFVGCGSGMTVKFTPATGDQFRITLDTSDGKYVLKDDEGSPKVIEEATGKTVVQGSWLSAAEKPYEEIKEKNDDKLFKEGDWSFLLETEKGLVWYAGLTEDTIFRIAVTPGNEHIVEKQMRIYCDNEDNDSPVDSGEIPFTAGLLPAAGRSDTEKEEPEKRTVSQKPNKPPAPGSDFSFDQAKSSNGENVVGEYIPEGTFTLKGHGDGVFSGNRGDQRIFFYVFDEKQPIDGNTITLSDGDTIYFSGQGSVNCSAR